MIDLHSILAAVRALVPTVVVIVLGGGALWFADRWLRRRAKKVPGRDSFRRELLMVGLSLVVLIALVLVLPVTEGTRGSLITLFSLGITAVIALSSTTLASNAMAGLMLRIVRNFGPGDYIRVGDFLGRVRPSAGSSTPRFRTTTATSLPCPTSTLPPTPSPSSVPRAPSFPPPSRSGTTSITTRSRSF